MSGYLLVWWGTLPGLLRRQVGLNVMEVLYREQHMLTCLQLLGQRMEQVTGQLRLIFPILEENSFVYLTPGEE